MEFEVKTGKLKTVASREKDIQRSLNNLNAEIENCRKNLQNCLESSASHSINQSIGTVRSRLGDTSNKIGRMGDKLNSVASLYENAEKGIVGAKVSAAKVAGAKAVGGTVVGKSTSQKVKDVILSGAYGLAKMATNTTKSIINKGKDIYKDLKESYDSHGKVYYALQYGKAAVKTGFAFAKIAGGIVALAGTGGGSSVASVCAIISGMNDIWNVTGDLLNLHNKNYDQVGKTNILKSAFGTIGSKIGGETGEKVGKAAFYGIDLVGNLAELGTSLGNLNNLKAVKVGKLGTEAKGIGQAVKATKVSSIVTGGVENAKYQITLAKYAFPETTKLIKDAGMVLKVADQTQKTIESEYEMFNDGEKIEAFEDYNKVQNIYGKGKKIVKGINKINSWHAAYSGI